MMSTQITLPRVVELINPTLTVLRRLGGQGTKEEILDEITQIMGLSEAQLQSSYTVQGTEIPRIVNLIAWAKVYLGAVGLIERLSEDTWTLTEFGRQQEVVDPKETIMRAHDSQEMKNRVCDCCRDPDFPVLDLA